MIATFLRRALVVLLFAALLAPVLEAFDSWDATPGLACDTEFHVAVLATAAGLLAAVAFAAVRIMSPLARFARLRPEPARDPEPARALRGHLARRPREGGAGA